MYEKIRNWYLFGLWTEAMVKTAARKGILTDDDADRILEEGNP